MMAPCSGCASRRRATRRRMRCLRPATCVYIADSHPASTTEADVDFAVRISAEISGLVRTLAEREPHNPAALWIVTRGVHESVAPSALRQSFLWGLAGVIAAEHPELWGGLADLAVDDNLDESGPALANLLQTPSKSILVLRDGVVLAPTLAPVRGRAGAQVLPMQTRCGLPHHRWNGRTWPADGRLARRPRRSPIGTDRPHAVTAKAGLGTGHPRRRTAPEDRRDSRPGNAGCDSRSRRRRHRTPRRCAGPVGQARSRRGRADSRDHPCGRRHERSIGDEDDRRSGAAGHVAQDRR